MLNKFCNRIKWLWSVALISTMLPCIIAMMYIFRPFNRFWRKTSRVYFWITSGKVQRVGEYDNTAQIIVLNHQGVIDISYLEAYYPRDLCWIAKKELGEIPLYGHALKAPRMIFVDRESKKSLVHLLKEAKDRLQNGRILAIFPEGTRSKGGREFLPFKDGAKIIIEKFNLKVQPIIMVNTRKLLDNSAKEVSAKVARVVCMDAFTPDFSDTEWYVKLKEQMHKTYIKHYDELNP